VLVAGDLLHAEGGGALLLDVDDVAALNQVLDLGSAKLFKLVYVVFQLETQHFHFIFLEHVFDLSFLLKVFEEV